MTCKVGYKLTEETKKRISEAKIKTWQNPEYRTRMLTLYNTPEWKTKQSNAFKVALNKPEVKEKMRLRMKERCENPKVKDFLISLLRDPETLRRKREANALPEFKKNASEKQKAVWGNPEYRDNLLNKFSQRSTNTEFKKKISVAAKRRFENPEERRKVSERQQRIGKDPDHRVRLSKALLLKNQDPEFHKKLCESRATPEYREMQRKLQATPEILLRKTEGQLGGFWYGNVRYSEEPQYCEKFNLAFKERVRAFWSYQCFECGTPQNGTSLHVHHVHYDKKMCCNGSPQDVVPLCGSCHGKTKHNRDYWEDYFTYLLYAYNPNGKCFFTKEEMAAFTGEVR